MTPGRQKHETQIRYWIRRRQTGNENVALRDTNLADHLKSILRMNALPNFVDNNLKTTGRHVIKEVGLDCVLRTIRTFYTKMAYSADIRQRKRNLYHNMPSND